MSLGLVDSGCPLGSFGVVGFTPLRPWGHWDHPGTLGAFGFHWVTLGLSGVVGFTGVRPGGRCVHPG